jgi:two-component sensor histidine kinase
VDWVVDADRFETKVVEVAARVRSMAWTSTRLTKKLTNMAFDATFEQFVEQYFQYQQLSLASTEHQQAMAEHRSLRSQR